MAPSPIDTRAAVMIPTAFRSGTAPGFTLLELLVTVAVLAILATVALPTHFRLVASHQLTAAANDLFVALQYARQESVRRNAPVQVCGSAGGQACDGGGWQQWIVRSTTGEVLRTGRIPPSVSVQPAGLFDAGTQFTAGGLFHQVGGRQQEGRMQMCSARAKRGLELEARGGVQLRLAAAAPVQCP
ncbi:GspH/FimT family pseudopilin [Stenotrophomonas sp. 24(2023)]|uniref:GspH/FimT family pseudopilin n=1 Tax=Stenotrophomonas sp. 24(2023) TaxID=3068324 RepID=UPI0027DEBA1E|nr:GspH/FimT family pseudopilin [Stenotrophomonas sp. 24(2023)]WMJ70943.1 GspH/FimT family pseudopilin [Stenotrophomonas sp. 24(2023)]